MSSLPNLRIYNLLLVTLFFIPTFTTNFVIDNNVSDQVFVSATGTKAVAQASNKSSSTSKTASSSTSAKTSTTNTSTKQKLGTTGTKKKTDAKVKVSPIRYEITVKNSGGQEAIDACLGGLTEMPQVSDYLTQVEGSSKKYYPIHNECGGRPILDLVNDDIVSVNGVLYKVVDAKVVKRGDKASQLLGIKGTVLLQTCFDAPSKKMRVVGLEPFETVIS